MKKGIKKAVVSSCVIITFINLIGQRGHLVEDLEIPNAVGYDIKDEGPIPMYSIPIRSYFGGSKQPRDSNVVTGEAITIGETRSNRQLKSNKEFLLGLEKVTIISEKQARRGIENLIDVLINNPKINDRAKLCVCKGKAKPLLEYEVKNYSGTIEYIGDLIERSKQFNFFTDRNTLMDFMISSSNIYATAVIPYLELKQDGIQIIGLAVFKGAQMKEVLDIKQTKIANLLRPHSGRGIISIQKNSKEYISFYPKAKRKIRCFKNGNSYKFIIELKLKGDVVSNQLYEGLNEDVSVLKQFQKDMEEHVQKRCDNFIVEMKEKYKMDILNLASSAVAKFGRNDNIDWDKVICNSSIEVKVKVSVVNQGRGKY